MNATFFWGDYRWIWPGDSKGDFDLFYAQYGSVPSNFGPIAVFAYTNNGLPTEMTHGSKANYNDLFESKCGDDLRILHILDQIESVLYGSIVGYYSSVTRTIRPVMLKITVSEKQKICAEILKIPLEKQKKFKKLFKKWKKLWFTEGLAFLSNPYTRAKGEEFEQLVKMGTESIPLVIEALAEPENFFAISLYERLQQDLRLHVKIRPDYPEVLEGEQSRAVRIIRKWLEQ